MKLFAAALRQKDSSGAFAFARSIAKDFPTILNPDVYQRTQGLRELFAMTSDVFPRSLTASEQGMRLDALFTLSDDYLQKVDVASMAFSLESRVPLLDQELIEWGMRLPLKWKLRGGQNKYLLRQLAYRYIPQKILDRPKQGFEVPIDRWLRGPLKEWALERIESRELYQESPLDQSRVRKLFDLHISGQRNVHPLLWASLMYLDFTAAQSSFVRQNQAAWGQSSA
jgi:asparagine synthase (glutamine-hydrolysing)